MPVARQGVCIALAALLGTPFSAIPASASDSDKHAQILEQLAPPDRQAYVERLIARQQMERAFSVAADSAPPVLTKFNTSTTLNLGKAAAPFSILVKATDDLSGVAYVYATATGPSGQSLNAYVFGSHPTTNFSSNGGFSSISRLLEPGAWKFVLAYGYDVAGNYFSVNEAGLAALGNNVFTVVNNSGYDLVKPALARGKVLTESVSLSSHAAGTTDKDPYVGVKLTATDAGNTALAGVKQGYAYFCLLAEPSKCIYLYGYVYATGRAEATFSATAQVTATQGAVPGEYELKIVYIYDHAGNYSYMQSDKFGGATNFTAMFPSTVIKLTP